MVEILLIILLIAVLSGLVVLCIGVRHFVKQYKEEQAQIILDELEVYEDQVQEDLEDLSLYPYQVFINADKKLIYQDDKRTYFINGVLNYWEAFPEQKGQTDLFLDKNPETCNYLFTGPFLKSHE